MNPAALVERYSEVEDLPLEYLRFQIHLWIDLCLDTVDSLVVDCTSQSVQHSCHSRDRDFCF